MAYSGFGYGNYSGYFQQQQQNQQQDQPSAGGSNQRYQGQQNPYSPYYQTNSASYGQQPSNDQQPAQAQQHQQQYSSKSADTPPYPQAYYQQPQQQAPYSQQRTSSENVDSLYSLSRQYGANTSAASPSTSAATTTAPYQYGQGTASHGDTSGPGSLAYASSLGRNSPAANQTRFSQPATSMSSYSSASPVYQTQQGNFGRDSVSSASNVKPVSPYVSQPDASTRPPQQAQGRQSAAATQYRQNQPAHSRVSSTSQQNRFPSPLQGPASRPTTSQTNAASQSNTQSPGLMRANSMKSPPVRTSSVPSAQQQSHGSLTSRSVESQRNDKMQSPSLMKASYGSGGAAPQKRQEDGPITVDPSQVFDQVEYQRRKAAAEAEATAARQAAQRAQAEAAKMAAQKAEAEAAKKAAEESEAKAEAARKKAEAEAAKQAEIEAQRQKSESQSRDQIQAEMKAMIERMREYKAQDPAAFTEIWEQFKKMQAPPARKPSQNAATGKPSTSKASTTTADPPPISPNFDNLPAPSPSIATPGDFEDGGGLQDRGKFPAMRRKTRADKGVARSKDPSTVSWTMQEANAGSTASPTQTESPAPAQVKPAAAQQPAPAQPIAQMPVAAQMPSYDPTGADSMRLAMARYHNTPTPAPSSSSQSSPPPGNISYSAYSPHGMGPRLASSLQNPQAKGTIWPEKDKAKLAAAAKRALESYGPNQGKTIATALIHSMLDRNPSYDQLCELLTAEGFQLDRSQFARTLLAVVPSADSPQPAANSGPMTSTPELPPKRKRGRPPKEGSPKSTPSRQSVSSQNNTPSSAAQPSASGQPLYSVPGLKMAAWQTQEQPTAVGFRKPLVFKEPLTNATPPRLLQGQNRSPSVTSQHSGGTPAPEYEGYYSRMRAMSGALAQGTTPSKPQQALTKQEAARKRNFSDIVDMTQASDDEESQRRKKEGANGVKGANKQDAQPQPPQEIEKTLDNVIMEQQPPQISLQQYRASNADRSRNERLRNQIVCQDLDFSKALRRMSYNPNTIARDVLISKGLHPTERPLNDHLAQFRKTFACVTHKSDLSTFRWDIVDPAPDAAPNVVDSIEKDPEKDREVDGHAKLGTSPPRGSFSVGPPREFKSILTRGGGVARGRLPKRGQGPLPWIRGRGRGRGGLVSGRGHGSLRSLLQNIAPRSPQPTRPNNADMDTDMTETQDEMSGAETSKVAPMMAASADVLNPLANPRVMQLAGAQAVPGAKTGTSDSGSSPLSAGSTGKRRGRPPGTKNRKTLEAMGVLPATPTPDGPKKRGRPPGSKSSPSSKDPSLPRRPGRPPKARPELINKTMPEDGVGVTLPLKPTANIPISYSEAAPASVKKKRNWKAGNLYPDNAETDAYLSFDCAWKGCQNRGLHNLETLQRHVEKLHVPKADELKRGVFRCSWGDCGARNDGDDGPVYTSEEGLKQHIENVHLQELARKLGDGPEVDAAGVDPSAYLSDSSGRQVTPLVLKEGPKDPIPLDANFGAKLAYHAAHGNLTPAQKNKALEESYRAHLQMGAIFQPVNQPDEYEGEETEDEEEEDGDEDEEEDEEMGD